MSGALLAQSKLPAVDYGFFFCDVGAIVRYAFVDKTHRSDLNAVSDANATTDDAGISTYVDVVPDGNYFLAFEISANSGVLPDREVHANNNILEYYDSLHVCQAQTSSNTRSQHDFDTMLTNQARIDAFGQGFQRAR